jgi:hypothetical protein
VVRHPLVQKIVVAYERSDQRRADTRARRAPAGRANGQRDGEHGAARRAEEPPDDEGSA